MASLTGARVEAVGMIRAGYPLPCAGMLHRSVFGRCAGYEDVNDADRLGLDSAIRWIGSRARSLPPFAACQNPEHFFAVTG
jgi:hypothetical protein